MPFALRVQLLHGRSSLDFSRSQGPPLGLVVVKKIRSKSLSVLSFFKDLQHCWDSLAQGLPAPIGGQDRLWHYSTLSC